MKKFRFSIKSGKFGGALDYFVYTFRNIEWPTLRQIAVYTLVVLIISAIISAYLLGADSLFSYLRNQLLF